MPRNDRDRSKRDKPHKECNPLAGVLKMPGPEMMRRGNATKPNDRGSQRSAQEVVNRAYAEWKKVPYDSKFPLNNSRCRRIRTKIRNALYPEDGEFNISRGDLSYQKATKLHGVKLQSLRRKLDAAYDTLEMAEDSWAADMFIQEVFKSDRKYAKAKPGWVHPRKRAEATAEQQVGRIQENAQGSDNDAAEVETSSESMPQGQNADFIPTGSVNLAARDTRTAANDNVQAIGTVSRETGDGPDSNESSGSDKVAPTQGKAPKSNTKHDSLRQRRQGKYLVYEKNRAISAKKRGLDSREAGSSKRRRTEAADGATRRGRKGSEGPLSDDSEMADEEYELVLEDKLKRMRAKRRGKKGKS